MSKPNHPSRDQLATQRGLREALRPPDTYAVLRAEMSEVMERFQDLQRRLAALQRLDELEARPPVQQPRLHLVGGAR